MDDLWLAVMQIVHSYCHLLGYLDPRLPGHLNIRPPMQQLKQIPTLTIINQQVVLIPLLGNRYQRH
jgi:hypothetical protein